jgi:mannose-1-phosphate guanylyltransferase
MSLLLIPVVIVVLSALAFLVIQKLGKVKVEPKVEPIVEPEIEPLGYEAAPAVALEAIKLQKVEKKKVSKNVPNNKPLAKIELKPKKAIKAKK